MSNCSGPSGPRDCRGPDSCPRNQHGKAEVKNKRKEKGADGRKREKASGGFLVCLSIRCPFSCISHSSFLLRK
jgi:hypothetical protein